MTEEHYFWGGEGEGHLVINKMQKRNGPRTLQKCIQLCLCERLRDGLLDITLMLRVMRQEELDILYITVERRNMCLP